MEKSRNKWAIALSVSMGGVMSSLDTFILYVATPNLRGVFSATVAEISWVSTSYAIASMMCMFLSGWFVDRLGAKRVYQSGLIFFVLGSILCSMAVSLEQLILYRVIQGLGAGILLPVEGVILRRTFPPIQHGLVMGLYGTSIMCGPAFGPMLGGILIDQFSWQFIFIVNIPIGIISFIMVRHYLNDEFGSNALAKNSARRTFDIFGIILLASGVISLIWLLERGDRTYWFEEDLNIALLVMAISSWAMLYAHSLSIKQPLLDFKVLKNKTFSVANLLNFLAAFMITGTLFVLPIYMQELLDFTPTQAGTTMAPRALVMMLVFPLVGYLFNRVPMRLLITAGLILGIGSGVMMSSFTFETGWHDMILPQVIQGVGAAFILGPVTTAALISIPKENMPAAAALESTTRLLGSTVGIAVFASLITHYELRTWELLRHNVTLSNAVLYKRFNGVVDFYQGHTSSALRSTEKAYQALNGRIVEQVFSITYMNIFQLIAAGFIFMLVISFFISLKNQTK